VRVKLFFVTCDLSDDSSQYQWKEEKRHCPHLFELR
jgi:hypothetical protein